jgi:hypothetical protein
MLKKLLPKELWKTKICNQEYWCGYDVLNDYIIFSKKYLRDKEYKEDLKKDLEIYFNITLTQKEYFMVALLHELGHKYYKNKYNLDELRDIAFTKVLNRLQYWDKPYEKEAMDFAKHFFKLYKEKQNEAQKI